MIASQQRVKLGLGAGLLLVLFWFYWPVLVGISERWANDPKYSHGYLVPLFALWLLWKQFRQAGAATACEGSVGAWWSLAILLPAMILNLVGVFLYMECLSEVSFLLCLAGLSLSIGGWKLLRIAGPSIGFLAFMLPLPFRVEVALALPLRHLATVAATYLLELLGFCASAEGNIIVLNHGTLGVEEACSGLGMIVTFLALTAAAAIALERPWLDRGVIAASAIPVALIANIIRITATGILIETVGGRMVRLVYHDLAGYLMMTLALALIWLELKLLSRLLVAVPVENKTTIDWTLGLTPSAVAGRQKKKVPVGK